jgi:hypothetical protein
MKLNCPHTGTVPKLDNILYVYKLEYFFLVLIFYIFLHFIPLFHNAKLNLFFCKSAAGGILAFSAIFDHGPESYT